MLYPFILLVVFLYIVYHVTSVHKSKAIAKDWFSNKEIHSLLERNNIEDFIVSGIFRDCLRSGYPSNDLLCFYHNRKFSVNDVTVIKALKQYYSQYLPTVNCLAACSPFPSTVRANPYKIKRFWQINDILNNGFQNIDTLDVLIDYTLADFVHFQFSEAKQECIESLNPHSDATKKLASSLGLSVNDYADYQELSKLVPRLHTYYRSV